LRIKHLDNLRKTNNMAKRYSSTGYLVKETIKGLPEAGKKVGGAIGKGIGIAMKTPFSAIKALGKAAKGRPPKALSPQERLKRKRVIESWRKSIERYKKTHPGKKIPKSLRGL